MVQTINIDHIPITPGVYIFVDNKKNILYIGKAKNLKKRVQQYFSPGSVWKQDMVNQAYHVDFIEVTTESEALYLEDNLIKQHQPPFNRLLKADNSYAYIKITKEPFGQVLITRQRKNDGATYIGPKHNTKMLRKLLQYLRQVYQFRTQNATQFRKGELDADYYFGLDKGRSIFAKLQQKNVETYKKKAQLAGLVIDKTYEEYKAEYKKILQTLQGFFKGKTRKTQKDIKDKIEQAVQKENFEYAAKLRDIYLHIEQMTENQHVVLSPTINGKIMQLSSINDQYILIIIHFCEGKIIDIIKTQYQKKESDQSQIITSIENELEQEVIIYHQNPNNRSWDIIANRTGLRDQGKWANLILVEKSMKKLKKADREALTILMQKCIDSYLVSHAFHENSMMNDLLLDIQKNYRLQNFPYTIECIDISHMSGSWISAGLSCFRGGVAYSKGYRRYKIQSIKEKEGYSNDYQALKEVILRRYVLSSSKDKNNDKEKFLPDLCIIDGGKAQLAIIQQLSKKYPEIHTIMKTTQFVSLGKGEARHSKGKNAGAKEVLYTYNATMENIQEQALIYDQADRLLTKIRDEAHRFANQYRKKRMSSERKKKR